MEDELGGAPSVPGKHVVSARAFVSNTTSSSNDIGVIMCYLCLQENPFAIPQDHSSLPTKKKMERAALIKELLQELEEFEACEDGDKEIAELKEEQYKLSREI